MRLRIVQSYESDFTLVPEAKAALFEQLKAAAFLAQVCQQSGFDQVDFTGLLFQPVPYTSATPRGMPAEFEPYHESPDHILINVPPPFMFKAKIFQPSRLCAIYRRIDTNS
ncbi:MAG: hypothetical protein HC886_11910 [Leptolyngbyaceae cyanobacterium SM1_1_3]|nr:hypothetical protein [Leptolyngbyaceae cyanobacterium SM1_1_3]NJM84931.1 hypothetical protein [Leptolyngbyaceae cyanobacterium RM2_2_21]NJN03393.1 hypothetical protein [Leptolyngbyaceae cyanobacterium RM1_1_2]NJO10447.1 hypothetical protein [Leptolyngbyaceae cyanobacterium SL_1_1]